MTEHAQHPSFLILDGLALGLAVDGLARDHASACARCTAYIAEARAVPPVPGWAKQLEPDLPSRSARRPMRWGIGATGLAALAAIAFLVLRPGSVTESSEYSTVRGAPAVGLYVKQGERVLLWDGQRPVAAGDRLRLKVVAEGFTHVSVLTKDDSGNYSILYEASVEPTGENVLPPAWEVDDAPGDESLTVILSRTPLASDSLGAIVRGGVAGDDVWVRRLSIPKAQGSLP